jgi:hypothetical protein
MNNRIIKWGSVVSGILLLIVIPVAQLMAQPNSSTVFEDVTDTPVNGGLLAMLALGVGYGIKKLYKKTK